MLSFLSAYIGWGTMLLQIVLGIIFIVHGWPKIMRPSGIANAVWMGKKWLGVIHGLVEMLGGIFLILGLWMEWIPFILAIIILGALYYKIFRWKVPFMSSANTGWEFDLLVLAGLLTLLLG